MWMLIAFGAVVISGFYGSVAYALWHIVKHRKDEFPLEAALCLMVDEQ